MFIRRIKRNRSDVLSSGNYYPLRKDFIKVLGLRGTAAILFTVIYSYSLNDDLQGSYYGTRKQLAEEVGVDVSGVTKHLKKLVEADLLEKAMIKKDSQWMPTYHVNIEKLEQKIDSIIEQKYGDKV